jgi:ribosomal protein L22
MAEKKPQNEEPENVEDVATEAEEAKEETPAKAEAKPKAKDAEGKGQKAEAKDKAEPEAKPKAKAKKADAEDEPSADEVAEQAKPDEVDKPKRRRGAAEVSASEAKPKRARDENGKVIVQAKARYVRCAPRKARLVVDHIRGKSVDEARAILIHTPRAASRDVLKLLDSAIANAENNHELVADELKIHQCFVDEGPTLKRFRPRALGRATRIRKRTSHMTILLTPKE